MASKTVGRRLRTFAIGGVAVSLMVALSWCFLFDRLTPSSWQTPVVYTSSAPDMWGYLAWSKAYMDGDIGLFSSKKVARLGAPYAANWNDFPITEELIPASIGWLGRLIGLFPAANIVCLLGHVLGALMFWLVAWKIGMNRVLGASLAVVYGLSNYNLARFKVGHLDLLFNFHVPLIILVSWWMLSRHNHLAKPGTFAAGVAVSAVSGILSPYYCALHLMFCAFGALRQLALGRMRVMLVCVLFMVVAMVGFLSMNLDTLLYRSSAGANPAAVSRDFKSLQGYSMSLPAMCFPINKHRIPQLAQWGRDHFASRSMFTGEAHFQYLGIVGLLGLIGLLAYSVWMLLSDKPHLIPAHFWQTLWLFVFSKAGALLLGVAGFLLLRGTNRYSVVILALSLLFMGRFLTRHLGKTTAAMCGIALLPLALWDQTPPRMPRVVATARERMAASDNEFSRALEARLPRGAMVFQMPVMAYPEPPSYIHAMVGYEHFRPYLNSHHVRFSYGSDKGRPDTVWQKRAEELPASDLLPLLGGLGFEAIIIDRRGYEDGGTELISQLGSCGCGTLAQSPLGDFCALSLPSGMTHSPPPSPPPTIKVGGAGGNEEVVYKSGWSHQEKEGRWAVQSDPLLEVWSDAADGKDTVLSFELFSLRKGTVKAWWTDGMLGTWDVEEAKGTTSGPLHVPLRPGYNPIHFSFSEPPAKPQNGDPRALTFMLQRLVVDREDIGWRPMGAVDLGDASASGALLQGFGAVEREKGRWTVGAVSKLTLPFRLMRRTRLTLTGAHVLHPNNDVPIVVTIGGISRALFLNEEPRLVVAEFDDVEGRTVVEFDIQTPIRPFDLGINRDMKPLGMFIKTIKVQGTDQPPRDGAPGFFDFKEGWSVDEGGNRWSIATKALGTVSGGASPRGVASIEFSAKTITPRHLWVYHQGKLIAEKLLVPEAWNRLSSDFAIDLTKGDAELEFVTDAPGVALPTDGRELSFFVRKPVVRIHVQPSETP